tara:strand:+ start:29333 stop:30577 length:1245 start_codon:yes stop_codon:yes gene_type:complete
MKLTFDNYLLFFVLLIPLALTTGPFLPDLFLSIAAIIFIISLFYKSKIYYLKNNFVYFSILFFLCLIISSIFSEFPLFSLKSSLVYFRFFIFVLVVWYLIDNTKKFIFLFFISLCLAYILMIISSIYQIYYGENFSGILNPSSRLLLLFSDEAVLGHLIARLFPLLIGLTILLYDNSFLRNFLIFFTFVISDTIIFLSGERTALMIMFLGSFFMLIFMKQLKVLRIVSIIVSIVVIALIANFNVSTKERNIDHTIKQLGIGTQKLNLFSPEHEILYNTGVKIFLNNPILGIGPNNYRNVCDNEEYANYVKGLNFACQTHPHNTYIQLFAETGVIGGIFIFIIIIYFLIKIKSIIFLKPDKKDQNKIDFEICIIACIFCSLWPLMPTLNIFNNWINVIYYLPVGFYLQIIHKRFN